MTSIQELLQGHDQMIEELKKSITQEIRCAMPGIIVDFDAARQTATIQPAVREGSGRDAFQMPVLLDVPVYFPGSSAVAVTFQVNPGDSCLVVFSDMCIDGWFQHGGVQSAPVPRRHSLSDAFAFVGFRPEPERVEGLDDGSLFAIRTKVNGVWESPVSISSSGRLRLVNPEIVEE